MRQSRALILLVFSFTAFAEDRRLPQPRVVDPGSPGKPPSDAVVLFDGKDQSHWVTKDGRPSGCDIRDAAMACKTGVGDLYSRDKFRSAQIHVEFAVPIMPEQKDQLRGNSGVYLHGLYEIQILDSYRNPTYADGSAAAVYGQHAPLVNASRPPEQWQAYDIIFHAPECNGSGQVTRKGRVSVLYNGVLVQDDAEIKGPTGGETAANACVPGPLELQDHSGFPGAPITVMRFRNIWFRPID